MSVRLRLQRHGAKKRPHYRVVATDQRSSRDGRFIELLGTYDPLQDPPVVRMHSERVEYWLGVGAQPSDTVLSLVRQMRRGAVIDLSKEDADKLARKEKAAAKARAQEELRAQAARAAREAQEAKKAEEAQKAAEAKAAEEAKKAAAEAPAEPAQAADAPAVEESAAPAGEDAGDTAAAEGSEDAQA